MKYQDDSIPYFLRVILLMLAILFLFNLINAVGSIVNAYRNGREPQIEVKVDTLYIHDTILVEKPFLQKLAVIDTLRLPVPIKDTVTLHDTIQITTPIRRLHLHRAGLRLSSRPRHHQDLQHHSVRHERDPRDSPPKRWHLGLQAGYGLCIHAGQPKFTPYVRVGVSYSLIVW